MNKSSRTGLYLVLVAALIAGYLFLNQQVTTQNDYSWQQLESALENDQVVGARIRQNQEVPTGSVVVDILNEGQKIVYVTDVREAEQLLKENQVYPDVEDVPRDNVFLSTLFPVLLTGGLVIMIILMMNRQMSGGGGSNAKMMNFGKSRARMSSPEDKKITFQNVAGLEEEKEDLVEVVDFLKNPQKYT